MTVDHSRGPSFSLVPISHPAHIQARFLTVPAYWPAFWLCRLIDPLSNHANRLIDPLSDSVCPWPV